MNDQQLAKAVSDGDPEAIREFVNRFYASVYRYAWVLCGRTEDAEDVTQEALLAARLRVRTYRGESTLRSWVHSVAFREFLRWRRRNRPWLALSPWLASRDRAFEKIDAADALQRALARLPEATRQAFVLTEICEFGLDEAAEVLAVPIGTVKSRCFHARRRLRELLAPSDTEEINGKQVLEG